MSPTAAARTILVAALFGVSFTGVAFARDQIVSARLVQPAAQTQIVANNAVWTCEAENCVARVSESSASVRGCRQFVRETGVAVASYGNEASQLSSEQLSQCNASVAPQTQQAQN